MISVEALTKRFADAEAVSNVTFRVEKGEILGLLGPNGAGKTTTMRMLTCFVPPSAGTAKVGGFDIYDQSIEVRRLVGYLPENVPLYGEMRVGEFLRFRARLKGVPRSRVTARLDDVAGRCGLGDVRNKVIDHLSKGFRQRVGLAESLLHEPPILILDEPTVGLDPKQIRQVRELIQDLGREHTIILSSHILPEVEQVCRRVVIIDRGKIVAQDRPDALRLALGGASRLDVEIRGDRAGILEALSGLPGVTSVREGRGAADAHGGMGSASGAAPPDTASGVHILGEPPGDGSLTMGPMDEVVFPLRAPRAAAASPQADTIVSATVESGSRSDLREDVFRLAVARGWVLLGLSRKRVSLEDVFIDLTTREAEDAAPSGEPQ